MLHNNFFSEKELHHLKKHLPTTLFTYFKAIGLLDNKLHVPKENGLVCRGQRLVLPTNCRADALQRLHIGHRGVVTCKTLARQSVYWPNINQDIEALVTNCQSCQENQSSNQHEPLLDRTIPDRPWQRLGIDFFELNQVKYLLVIDYFSKFIELQPMHTTTARAVINALKIIYSRWGIPVEVVSDNGPPFNSDEYKAFNTEWDIKINTSSPHYPRSNGQVERCIQTLMKGLIKAKATGQDLNAVVMAYRNTPSGGLPSPAEMNLD